MGRRHGRQIGGFRSEETGEADRSDGRDARNHEIWFQEEISLYQRAWLPVGAMRRDSRANGRFGPDEKFRKNVQMSAFRPFQSVEDLR